MVLPPAERAGGAALRPRFRPDADELLQPLPGAPGVCGVVGQPETGPFTVAKLDMRGLGSDTLEIGQQIRIEHELEQVLRIGLSLELGVGDLVAPVAQVRGPLDPFEEVGPPAPGPAMKRRLKDDIGTGGERLPGLCQAGVERKPLARHFHDAASRGLQSVEMRRLVRIPHLLEKLRLLVICPRLRTMHLDPGEIERRRMGTAGEPHQV